VGCSLEFELWAWSLEASLCPAEGSNYYILLAIYIYLAQLFGLSPMFGHSILRPLDFDGHRVKRPLVVVVHPCRLSIEGWPIFVQHGAIVLMR
jgi:hypothetical protein